MQNLPMKTSYISFHYHYHLHYESFRFSREFSRDLPLNGALPRRFNIFNGKYSVLPCSQNLNFDFISNGSKVIDVLRFVRKLWKCWVFWLKIWFLQKHKLKTSRISFVSRRFLRATLECNSSKEAPWSCRALRVGISQLSFLV